MDASYFTATHRRFNNHPQPIGFQLACVLVTLFLFAATASAASPNSSSKAHANKSNPSPNGATKTDTAKSDTIKSNSSTSDSAKSTAVVISTDDISNQIKQLEAAGDADQPNRAALIDLYRQALADVKQSDDQKSRIAELEKQRIAAPYQLELRKREIVKKPTAPAQAEPSLPATASLDDWEQALDAAEQELQAAQKAADDMQSEQKRRAARRLEIPQAIAAARMKLDDLQQSASPASADDPALAQAQHVARRAQQLALETEIALAEKELQTYDNTAVELLSLQREAADENAALLEKRVAKWRDAVNHRRESEADQQAAEARLTAVTAVPAIRHLADENSDLASQRAQLTKSIETLSADREAVVAHLDKINDQFKQASDKLTATGLTEAVGQMLLKERAELATVEADRRAAKQRQQEIARVQVELFELQDQLSDLHNLDASVEQLHAALPKNSEANRSDLRRLLQTKRKYLEALVDDDNSYFADLVDTDSKQRELIAQADAFRDYIDQRVLWVRSTHPLAPGDARKTLSAIAWILRPSNWWAALCEAADALRNYPTYCFLAALIFIPWAWSQHRLRKMIQGLRPSTADNTNPSGQPEIRRACESAVATLLIAAIWPALAWFVGWLLVGGSAGHGEFPEALGSALQITAAGLLPLLLLRQICRHDGLAQVHFQWPTELLLLIRRQLTRLAMAGAPALLIVTLLEAQSTQAWKNSLGRLVFIAGQLAVAAFVLFVLRPPHGPLHRLMNLRPDSWTSRLSVPAFVALLIFPLALATLALTGYYYTSLRLACRLQTSIWLVLGLVIAQSLISIWLTGVYRKLAVKTAERLARPARHHATSFPALPAAASVRSSEKNGDDATTQIDIEKVDAQTQGLLHNLAALALAVGLCFVWIDMFPALQFLNQITLWPDVGTDPNHRIAVTLANLLEAGVVAALTVVAAANLPSLLDLALLQHLMPDRGSRYALVAIIRYTIIVVGVAAAGAIIGIGWAKLQWLIAAMSFGLGFGLQEIFANFVSGLIVLFERPVRVGDTVTVGDVTGVVSRIKMRATTIVDADRKELIIPNKDLVSGRLVNWTLTDSVIRLVIRLGIAYGSDTAQAQRLLLEVASKIPEVIKTPSPKAVFMGFGEKSLDFELRVFVSNVDVLLPVRHQLNMLIDHTFHAAGVEIAFAQADTYIRTNESTHQPLINQAANLPDLSSAAAPKAA